MREKIDFGMVFKLCLLFSISLIILTVLVGSNIISEFITSFLGEKSIEIDRKLLIEIIKIIISIVGACFVSQRYLNDRKNKTITENRINWMYKIREYIVELNDCLNNYVFSINLSSKEIKNLKVSIQNHIDKIILYLAPDTKSENKKRSELDIKLEKALLAIDNTINSDSDVEIIIEKQRELLSIARIYFKIEWEKVKYEVKNNAQDLFDTDKYYKRHYK